MSEGKIEMAVKIFNTTKFIGYLLCSQSSDFRNKEEVRLRWVLKDK